MRSEICVFNIETNETEVIASADDIVLEAPNWSPDGLFLILNGEGVIFRVDLDEPNALQEISTDFAIRCNACHGISPDGQTLAFSQGAETSIIYTVSIDGGVPTRMTIDEPAFFHGWSPDGQTLIYSARPSGPFQVFTMSADGGEPTKLTEGDGYKDGPSYSPDGSSIWFNADMSGTMQIWRMKSDGSAQQQVTHDDRTCWWPHVSPDGSQVLYLSYEADADPRARDANVELRIMSADGGEPRVLTSFVGGHGTINGPCWAPDSKRFAFMRYASA